MPPRRLARVQFDAGYYARFYHDPRTRVVSPQSARRRAEFVVAYLRYLEVPVRRVLDVGCGPGYLLRGLSRALPSAHCVGVENSAWLCERHGWLQGSVDSFHARTPFDLVVCDDVLQYLDATAASAAIANLAQLSRAALWFSALTREQWRHDVDRTRTDARVWTRSAAWYATRLEQHFTHIGSCLYVRDGTPVRGR